MDLSGWRPRYQAGKSVEVIRLLPCRGGIRIITRSNIPDSTRSRVSISVR